MQFGIFSVGDVTADPTTGRAPTEHERIQGMIRLALKAEEVGLDVFATGEHHNPPFVPSSPTTFMGYVAAKTSRLILSTATSGTGSRSPSSTMGSSTGCGARRSSTGRASSGRR
jgi:alkanesulfonate monooxygenase SsuD/methylene tetrahydromethanopterin reductase-like flavin-dependent oxidoreductase (luciferase family)